MFGSDVSQTVFLKDLLIFYFLPRYKHLFDQIAITAIFKYNSYTPSDGATTLIVISSIYFLQISNCNKSIPIYLT